MSSFEGVMIGKVVIAVMLMMVNGDIVVQDDQRMHLVNTFLFLNPNEAAPWTELDFNKAPPPAPQPYYSRVERRCFEDRKVFYMGFCWNLLIRGPCTDGQWLVLDPSIAGIKPTCQPKLCASDKAYWEPTGECILLTNKTICNKPHTSLQVDLVGYGSCKCTPGLALAMAPNGVCYKLYTRGFCDQGYVVAIDSEADQHRATCIPDKCAAANQMSKDQNKIYLPYKDSCYPDGSHDPCPEDQGLSVEIHTGTPACATDLVPWHIVNPPPRCPLLDHTGNCRDKITVRLESYNYVNELNTDQTKHRHKFNKG